jgi:hypothetical protein
MTSVFVFVTLYSRGPYVPSVDGDGQCLHWYVAGVDRDGQCLFW